MSALPSAYSEAWLVGPQNTKFYTRTYSAENAIASLVFIHGAAEHAGRYTDMHTSLSKQHNINVFVFDLRGFGKTALDKENKSADSAYGKTNWEAELDDVEWAVNHAKKQFSEVPLFLMGTSMGGGIVLGIMCEKDRASHEAIKSISGVIAGSPCIRLTHPTPAPILWIARSIAHFAPYTLFPARNKPEDLSRNPETNAAYATDPFISTPGSLRSLGDMIDKGARILTNTYVNWPKKTPVLFLHGIPDPVTSPKAAKQLFDKLDAEDKNMITYPDAFHELHNEPDGIREKSLADIVDFIKSHVN